jgi:hypothetical protein
VNNPKKNDDKCRLLVCRERFHGGEPILNMLLNHMYLDNIKKSDGDFSPEKNTLLSTARENSIYSDEIEYVRSTSFSTLSIPSIGSNYIYMNVCICIYIKTYLHIYIYVYRYVCIYIYTCVLIIGIFVGPEGGFTTGELESMEKEREAFSFVTLGDRYVYIYIYIYMFRYGCLRTHHIIDGI